MNRNVVTMHFRAFSLVVGLLGAACPLACAVTPASELAEEESADLRRFDDDFPDEGGSSTGGAKPKPKPKPPVTPPPVRPQLNCAPASEPSHAARHNTQACQRVFGVGGRWEPTRLFENVASAPPEVKERFCQFDWVGQGCAYGDKEDLHKEGYVLTDRLRGSIGYTTTCAEDARRCMGHRGTVQYLSKEPLDTRPYQSHEGGCEACGLVLGGNLYVVVPPDFWHGLYTPLEATFRTNGAATGLDVQFTTNLQAIGYARAAYATLPAQMAGMEGMVVDFHH